MTVTDVAAGLTDTQRLQVAESLRAAADTIAAGVGDTYPEPGAAERLLEQLRAVRSVFDLVESGNAARQEAPGLLRSYRHHLYHRLADLRVPRATIAEVAGVSGNAIGGAIKGQRRGRPRAVASNGDTAEPTTERKRRPRPG